MKVSFVVPRYGRQVVGGAETAARLLAEHLAVRPGWEVEVLTSCAADFVTWEDVLPPGETWVDGVRVHRFASTAPRHPSFHPLSAALLSDPTKASRRDSEHWVDLQGPVVPELAEAAVATDADAVVFYPYLYYPTVRVIDRVSAPTILHPAAHDEPALRLPVFPEVFAAADGLVFQTAAERDLVQRLFPVATHHQLLVGLGVDDPHELGNGGGPGGVRGRNPCGTSDRAGGDAPYLLCLGRVDGHKGTSLLASLFAAYAERHAGPLRLVFAGPVIEPPDPHPRIDIVGPVPEDEKWALLQGAVALVSPSALEAFSLVVAEAWSAGTPVLVNADCAATVEHCRRSGGGLPFAGFGQFEAAVSLLVEDGSMRGVLGSRGRNYVDRWFRWPPVIDRYARFIESVVAIGH